MRLLIVAHSASFFTAFKPVIDMFDFPTENIENKSEGGKISKRKFQVQRHDRETSSLYCIQCNRVPKS